MENGFTHASVQFIENDIEADAYYLESLKYSPSERAEALQSLLRTGIIGYTENYAKIINYLPSSTKIHYPRKGPRYSYDAKIKEFKSSVPAKWTSVGQQTLDMYTKYIEPIKTLKEESSTYGQILSYGPVRLATVLPELLNKKDITKFKKFVKESNILLSTLEQTAFLAAIDGDVEEARRLSRQLDLLEQDDVESNVPSVISRGIDSVWSTIAHTVYMSVEQLTPLSESVSSHINTIPDVAARALHEYVVKNFDMERFNAIPDMRKNVLYVKFILTASVSFIDMTSSTKSKETRKRVLSEMVSNSIDESYRIAFDSVYPTLTTSKFISELEAGTDEIEWPVAIETFNKPVSFIEWGK